MNDSIFDNKVFDGMEENRKAALKELYFKIQGKSLEEALPFILTFKMPEGKKITDKEKYAMIGAVLEGMNDRDRITAEKILKLLGQ